MLEQLIREKVKTALLEKDEASKNILRVVLGEIDVLKGRGQTVEDEQVHKILRKLIASNEETIKAMTVGLRRENEILDGFLPQLLTKEEIKNHLNSVATEIMSAKSDGQATGVAVGVFKKAGLAVDGSDVSEIVKKMRSN